MTFGLREAGAAAIILFATIAVAQEAAKNAPPASGGKASGPQQGGASNEGGALAMPAPGAGGAQNTGQQPKQVARPLTPEEMIELRRRMATGAGDAILSPNDIQGIKSRVWDAQGAQSQPWATGEPPMPRPRVVKVDKISALGTPTQLYLAYGVVSPITFVDAKGKPWPIAGVSYDPRLFAQDGAGCGAQVQASGSGGQASSGQDRPTSINLMPCRFNVWGNIIISLENISYPIVFMVRSGGPDRVVDVPITISVAGVSPLAPTLPARATPSAASPPPKKGKIAQKIAHAPGDPGDIPDPTLNAFADGVPPKGAVRLTTDNDQVSAWSFNGRLYVRGKITLLNPPYDATAETTEGVTIWRVADLVTRVLVSDPAGRETAVAIAY